MADGRVEESKTGHTSIELQNLRLNDTRYRENLRSYNNFSAGGVDELNSVVRTFFLKKSKYIE